MFVVVENDVFQRFHSPDTDYVAPSGATIPASALRSMPEAQRNALGVFTLHDGDRPSDLDYFVSESSPALVNGSWSRQYTSVAKSAANFKEQVKQGIDAQAENERLKYVTPGSGQAAVYIEKKSQADQCLAVYSSGNPPPTGTFPLLDATVGIEFNPATNTWCANAYEVAQVVTAIAAQWLTIAAAIETKRLGGKKAVDAATTMAELRAAANIDWTIS